MDPVSFHLNKVTLADFYSRHDWSKIDQVEEILIAWPVLDLQDALQEKYGEVPNLISFRQNDNAIVSSDDSDLAVVSTSVKKVKKQRKKKRKERDLESVKARISAARAKRKAGRDHTPALTASKAKVSLPANWGLRRPPQMQNQNMKRKLSRESMRFIDEAIRRKLDERMRRTAELREASLSGGVVAVVVLDGSESPKPSARVVEPCGLEVSVRSNNNDCLWSGGAESEAIEEETKKDGPILSPNRPGGKGFEVPEISPTKIIRKTCEKDKLKEVLGECADASTASRHFINFESFVVPRSNEAEDTSDSEESIADEGYRASLDYWTRLPEELLCRSDLEDSAEGSRAFVAHFIRYVVGVWNGHITKGIRIRGRGLTDFVESTFNNASVLDQTKASLEPLLLQLQRNSLSRELLIRLDVVATLAAQREYKSCMEEYMVLTMGKKTWFQSHTQSMMQQNHGGGIAKILKQSEFIDFDKDPIANAYIMALKRLIQFLQWLHPPVVPSYGVGI